MLSKKFRALLGVFLFSLGCACCSPSGAALADDAERDAASEAVEVYFEGERAGGVAFMSAGGAALMVGGVMVAFEDDFTRSFSYPLFAVGALHVMVGAIVYARSDAQAAALKQQLIDDPQGFVREEGARIQGVEGSFLWLEVIEGILIVGGVTSAAVGMALDEPVLAGVGMGLATEAALTLILDLWAGHRASRYSGAIQGFSVGAGVTEGGEGWAVSCGWVF